MDHISNDITILLPIIIFQLQACLIKVFNEQYIRKVFLNINKKEEYIS